MNANEVMDQIAKLFERRGSSLYGGEAVTQTEHALQAALLAEQAQAPPAMIVAAVLHDVGHLLHDLPADAPDHGVDDEHEQLADRWLRQHFAADVCDPVRLHVAAKRYLCAVDADYAGTLSPPSLLSLQLQGGPMSASEAEEFRSEPYFAESIALRRWDDQAKVAGLPTPGLAHFLRCVPDCMRSAEVIERTP
ncbi:MAG TPA: metal-dependent phosphohydrolase [Lacipirellulaceae bacterium]|nr:metal-dependent phosphohydrolase [Lacipirellulaceae bacterium]HMP06873.1 metal-dependent phosphohydrolase [Lacipirellulaceae bacterium]